MHSLVATPVEALSGTAAMPGDKSISHRALILGSLAVGETNICGLLEGQDVLCTAAAVRTLGAEVTRDDQGRWRIWGRGIGGLIEPEDMLDLGNSGTAARLLLGVLAGHPLTAVLTGDASLRSRPMRRVAEPLQAMGARLVGRADYRLPLAVVGAGDPLPIEYTLPVPSAQVKSAVLLASLNAEGATSVIEPQRTRDHTELMLRHFGAEIRVEDTGFGRVSTLRGQPELMGQPVVVPGDASSAAFPAVAALLLPGSEIRLPGIGINPHRLGLYQTLLEMGADIEYENQRDHAGEPLADIIVRGSALSGITVPAERAPAMIDDYPILAVAAACARGTTIMHGLSELRVKESDRLSAIARGLALCGVSVEATEDSLIVHGTQGKPAGGVAVETRFDHRIAMSFLMLGLAARRPISVDDGSFIDTSFPGFVSTMNSLGAKILKP